MKFICDISPKQKKWVWIMFWGFQVLAMSIFAFVSNAKQHVHYEGHKYPRETVVEPNGWIYVIAFLVILLINVIGTLSRLKISYVLQPNELQICLWGIEIRTVSYNDIKHIKKSKKGHWGIMNQRSHNLVSIIRNIKPRLDYKHEVNITPENRDLFIAELEKRAGRSLLID